ncbi:PglL family O-oligosaccharyltransferase [Acinetobacter haemolyticus]|uniref:PglL family O-oligosaccharyltransferase n=1 Tax=Acinetobacter haemolyticus TaxID=29430 RepID=UPI000DE9D3F7|nr:Wzy polymerase domain-containing protein [Acinetobacter haemolyticus]WHR56680.1 Wzy polymerase domain-containing protein [Acinetobacter haemolyticus]
MKTIYIFVAFFCLLAWLLPNHYQPWLSFYQDLSMFVAVLLLASSFLKQKSIQIPYILTFFIFLSLIPLIQYYLGIVYFFGEAITFFFYLLALATVFIVGFNIAQLERSKKENIIVGFLITILIASIISVWIQLRQWLLFEGSIWVVDMSPKGRPFANIAQPNQLSTLLIMGLMSILYLFEKEILNKVSASFTTLFLLFGVALTQSRTAWVFAICLLIWLFIKRKVPTRLKYSYLILWCCTFFSMCLCSSYLSEILGVTSVRDLAQRATTGLDRIGMWQQILIILKDAPLLGYGWGQLNVAQLSNTSDSIATPLFGYSHNLILDILVWNGVLLGGAISLFILIFLVKIAINVKDRRSIIILAMVGAILVHSMFEYPFAYAYFLLPMGFLIGFLYAQQDCNIKFFYLNKFILRLFVLFFLFLMLIFFYDYKKVEANHELMRYENVKLRNVDVNSIENKAIFLNQLNEYVWFARQTPRSGLTEQELKRIRYIVYRYPERPVLYRYLQFLYLNDQDVEMKQMLRLFNAFYKSKITEYEVGCRLMEQGLSK